MIPTILYLPRVADVHKLAHYPGDVGVGSAGNFVTHRGTLVTDSIQAQIHHFLFVTVSKQFLHSLHCDGFYEAGRHGYCTSQPVMMEPNGRRLGRNLQLGDLEIYEIVNAHYAYMRIYCSYATFVL